jgi:predicted transglutaminase-like protease
METAGDSGTHGSNISSGLICAYFVFEALSRECLYKVWYVIYERRRTYLFEELQYVQCYVNLYVAVYVCVTFMEAGRQHVVKLSKLIHNVTLLTFCGCPVWIWAEVVLGLPQYLWAWGISQTICILSKILFTNHLTIWCDVMLSAHIAIKYTFLENKRS